MKIIKDKEYRGYKINNGNEINFECDKRTLDSIVDRLEYMCDNHSKVLCCRLDIRTPVGSSKSIRESMGRIMETSKRKMESRYKSSKNKLEIQDIRKFEKAESSNHEHAHLFIMVNGNTINNGWSIKNIINEAVKKHFATDKDGLVNFSESNGKKGIMIDRSSSDYKEQYNKAIYAASYLAKINTTDKRPKGGKFSTASRLPKK